MWKEEVGQRRNDYSGLVGVPFWLPHHGASCDPGKIKQYFSNS